MVAIQMMEDQGVILAIVAAEEVEREQRRQRRPRSVWVRPWLARRPTEGAYERLMRELERESHGDFKGFLRVEPQMFHELVRRVGPRIQKSQKGRTPLVPGLKMAITLRYLATGNSYHSLMFTFRVAHNTISNFVPSVCEAIVEEYRDEQFTIPSTPEAWRRIESTFSNRWNYHHCCGALDGKHVRIVNPHRAGSAYYCHKGFYSIILLALVDANYKFVWVNIGEPGSNSDAGIYNQSTLEPALREQTLGLPPPDPLPGDDRETPYFIMGDDAFALREYMMKPYSARYLTHHEEIFNYRTSRARRVVENAFGIMAARWRCFHYPIGVSTFYYMQCHFKAFKLFTLHNSPFTLINVSSTCFS